MTTAGEAAIRRAAEDALDWLDTLDPEVKKLVIDDVVSLVDTALARAVSESWEPRCGETGKLSIKGVCPEHGGDACLMASAIVRAVAEERERCAKIAEGFIEAAIDYVDTGSMWRSSAAKAIAQTLRAAAPAKETTT